MSELTSKQKKEWAQHLFVKDDMTQKEIAKKVQVSEQTMTQWVNKEGWERLKISLIKTKPEELKKLYQQLKDHNDSIMSRAEGKRNPTSKEMDVTIKLTAAIKNLEIETSIAQTIDVFMGYTNFMRSIDLKEAQKQSEFIDTYIKHLLNRS